MRHQPVHLRRIGLTLLFVLIAWSLSAREKDATQYGMPLIVNVPFPVNEVEQVVQDIVQNGIIRGTKEYNKDEFISGAEVATSTRVFPQWTEGGKVFYKVRLKALDPRNFKDSSDVGTLAVRYVVQAQGEKNTVIRIDARFVEDFRKTGHASNGSVESAEYKDIHERLDSISLMKAQTEEIQKSRTNQSSSSAAPMLRDETPAPVSQESAGAPVKVASDTPSQVSPPQTLEQRVQDLRRQVQRLVKAPGAPLQAAPFHTAATLKSLPAGTEVLIVISTPYWFGVETHDGQHGWMLRDELEQIP